MTSLGKSLDQHGNILISSRWHEDGPGGKKVIRFKQQIVLQPKGKHPDQVRAEISAFRGNVMVELDSGYLFVCLHCGSRRSDKFGIGAYSDDDPPGYVWDEVCIKNAVLVTEDEYIAGRRAYEAARTT